MIAQEVAKDGGGDLLSRWQMTAGTWGPRGGVSLAGLAPHYSLPQTSEDLYGLSVSAVGRDRLGMQWG